MSRLSLDLSLDFSLNSLPASLRRFLPGTITAGLFPGQCWLRRGGKNGERIVGAGSIADGNGLLAELDAMLTQAGAAIKGSRLHIVVSDNLAAITTLAWQEKLTSPDELQAYAHACFERNGVTLDAAWVLQTGFRHFGATGLAYALPQTWLTQLQALCEKAGVRLESVLPVSAAAYWRQQGDKSSGQRLVLLMEAHRLSVLVCEAGRLQAIDVQPVNGDAHAAGLRLLARVAATRQGIGQVQCWTPVAGEPALPLALPAAFIAASLSDAAVSTLSTDVWS